MDINCTSCGKEVACSKAFYINEHTCCSIDCVRILKSKSIENKSQSNYTRQGAFVCSFGGGSF